MFYHKTWFLVKAVGSCARVIVGSCRIKCLLFADNLVMIVSSEQTL